MTNAQGKQMILDIAASAAATGQLDRAAKLEVIAEYLTNEQFRKGLQDHVWNITKKAEVAA